MGIQESQARYAAKVPTMGANYAAAMSQFFNHDVSGSLPVRAYQAKIGPGTAAKWASNLSRAFGV